jgi:hypothetical protein
MKTKFLVTLVTFLFSFATQAQEQRCGFTHKSNLEQEKIIKQLISQKAQSNARTEEKTYTIPVLFHIIQTDNPNDDVNKITKTQIDEQLKVINEDYNRLNADTVRTPEMFKNMVGKISINFVLAKTDNNGVVLKEEGIIRHTKFGKTEWQLSDFERDVKPQTIRNPYKYLNIWVVNELKDGGNRLLGFAQFPDFSPLNGLDPIYGTVFTDGVIITSRTLVSLGQINPIEYRYGYGRTLTHELGHFLGILHTFSDIRGLCTDNDFCEDTPRLSYPTEERFSCQSLDKNKCETIAMPENFMDYTNDACMNLFTKCQVERMKLVLEKCPRRKELTTSTVTSVRDENLAEKISIFPNPTNAFFTIKTENLQIKNLKIFSVLGQQVYENNSMQANSSMDISHLSKAIYVLQIETERGMVVKKLVLE